MPRPFNLRPLREAERRELLGLFARRSLSVRIGGFSEPSPQMCPGLAYGAGIIHHPFFAANS